MAKEHLFNMYDLTYAAIKYNYFLNQNKFSIIDDTNELSEYPKDIYEKLIVTTCGLIFTLIKEEITIDGDDGKYIDLNPVDKAQLIAPFIKVNEGRYQLGNIIFDDYMQVINFIRNKLMHGDFYIANHYIIMENEDKSCSIKVDDLVTLSFGLFAYRNATLNQSNVRTMCLYKRNKSKDLNEIKTKSDFRKVCDDICLLEIQEQPRRGFSRNANYFGVFKEFINDIKRTFIEIDKRNIDMYNKRPHSLYISNVLNQYNKKFNDIGCIIGYKTSTLTESPYYKDVENVYFTFLKHSNGLDANYYIKFIMNVAAGLQLHDTDESFLLLTSLINNVLYLSQYINGQNIDIDKFHVVNSITYIDDMAIGALFNAFYNLYQYGLDTIISRNGSTSLKDVIKSNVFDFSSLDLDSFYDPNMTIEVSFRDFPNQLERMKNSEPKLREKIDLDKASLNKYIDNCKDKDEEVLNKLFKIVESSIDEYDQVINMIPVGEVFIDIKFEKFVKNYNIIAHIRNAFAHGNVKLLPYTNGDTLQDRTIVIEDIHEGRCTYRVEVSYLDFYNMICGPGTLKLLDFIDIKVKKELNTIDDTITVKVNKNNIKEENNKKESIFKKIFGKKNKKS